MTNYNILVVTFASLGSLTWGYVAGIIASTLGQPTFNDYIGLTGNADASALIGAANGLFSAGGFLGCFVSVYLNERRGRLEAILLGALLAALGSILSAASVHIVMFIIARFIVGLGVGNLLVLIPLYQSEVSPPGHRGLYVGLHGVMLCFGYVLSNWIGYAFYFVTNPSINWRLPLAFGAIPCLILAAWVLKLPQSPRWLVAKGRIEEARKVCRDLHYNPSRPESTLAEDELYQIMQQDEIDRHTPTGWRAMVSIPHYRRRCIIGFLTTFFVQCSGNLVITNYAPLLYGRLGYDTNKQLLMAGAWITMCPFGNMLNAWMLDKVGRRPILIIGLYGCVLCLVVEAISVSIYTSSGNTTASYVAVAFLFIHMFFFSSSQDASSYVYISEIFPNHIRAKGVAISTSGLFVSTIILVSAAPIGFQEIGWKYYLVLAVPAFVGATAEYFFWPETRGLPLEEIAAKFGDVVAVELEGFHGRIGGALSDEKGDITHVEGSKV